MPRCNLRRHLMKFNFYLFLVGVYISCSPLLLCQPSVSIKSDSNATETAPAELVVQLSHANPIVSMAISKNGQLLSTVGEGETVRLWDAKWGNEIRQLKGIERVSAVALSEDGRFLLIGRKDATACLCDTASGKKILTLEGHTEELTTVAISPDACHLFTGSKDKTVRQWKASDGSLMKTLEGFPGEITSIAISSDGRYALIGCHTIAELWGLRHRKRIHLFEGHTGGVYTVAISPDGRLALTGSQDYTARLWDVSNGKEKYCYKGHQRAVMTVTFSGNGETVATGSKDGTIRLWDIESGKEKLVLSVELGKDGTMHIWDAKSKRKRNVLTETFVPEISKVALSRDGKIIFFAAGTVAGAWSVEKSSLIRSFAGNSDLVSSAIFSPDDNLILIGSWDNTAYLWDAASGKLAHRLEGHKADVRAVAFSPDGSLILTGGRDDARLWCVNSGTEIHRFTGHEGGILPVAFSPRDGRFILTGGDDGTARLWDREQGYTEVHNFGPHEGKVTCAIFSPDGHKVLTASEKTIQLWDRKSGVRKMQKFQGHKGLIYSVAFSPNGNLVVSGSMDNTARVWNVESGKQILKKPLSHPKGVMTAVFSQDGRYILTGCEDGLARLWDTVSGAELRRFHGHTSGIWQVSLSQNQRYMLSASRDQTVRLWEVATGRELCRLISFRDGSWAVVDKEGRFDASNGGDVRGLHWVVGNETIELHQLKERYYEPGLLSKLFGFNQELLRNVVALRNVALYPALKLKEPTIENPTLEIYLTNRGGGIGKLTISINGKEVSADARGKTTDPEDPISFGLKNQPYLIPGKDNVIEVRAFNAEGYLSSRGVAVAYQPPGEAPIDKPTLWAILAGVSQYEGEDIKLRYAAKDAEAMATALTLGAKRLFGAEKVQITLLSTEPKNFPTRANIKQAFEKVCTAKPWDILVVYLAGHGVALGDTYYYLTQEARSTNLTDPDIRELVAISSDDLVKWIKKSPALKQVMVLDTCAAGAAARKLVEPRNISSDQIRAIERLKDRTGFHVLMGSAADAVSYEATQYEQGLLTYALLQGMRGAALREKEYVDVNRLFQHAADAVPDLATHIGGVQRPVIAAPKGTSFDIGQLNAEDRQQIPLAQSKPILLPPVLLNGELFHDDLNLTDKLRRQLREDSYAAMRGTPRRMSAVYLDADQLTGAIRPSGTYRVEGNNVKVNLVLVKDGTKLSEVQVQGSQTDLRVLIENLVEAIFQAVE